MSVLTAQNGNQKKNEVKGQGQIASGYGKFGETYTMASGLNLTIYNLRCSVDFYTCYGAMFPHPNEKLVVMEFGVKNSNPQDAEFGDGAGYFTLVTNSGEKYESVGLAFQSTAFKGVFVILKPGQGAGTPEMKDPLRVAFTVPMDAKPEKIIVKEGRKAVKSETIFRYLIAGSDPQADPKNVLKPLPEGIRNPEDKSGFVGLEVGNTEFNKPFPTGRYVETVSSMTKIETEKFADEFIEEGKAVWCANITVTCQDLDQSLFEAQTELATIEDTDGERYTALGYYKAKSDEITDSGRKTPKGEAYSMRLAFVLPKTATPKTLTIGANGGILWKLNVTPK